MKDYAGMRCPGCGGELGPYKNGKYQCSHCREVFSSDILDGYFCSMYNRTGPSSIREAVAQELDKQLADEIGRNRNVLNQELMKKYPDKEMLKNLCLDIEKLWPGEIQATCIRVACSSPTSEELKQVLDSIDVNSFQIYYVDGILDYLFEHVTLKERDLAPISYLIHRAYENKDREKYARYCQKYEEEADAISKDRFDCMRERDVFIAHATENREVAFDLLQRLEGSGYECFLAERDLKHGSPSEYKTKMPQAIENCRIFVLISSEVSRKSSCGTKEEMDEVRRQDIDFWSTRLEYDKDLRYEDIPDKFKKARLEFRLDKFSADRAEESQHVRAFFGRQEWVDGIDKVVAWIENHRRDIQANCMGMDDSALIPEGKRISYEQIDWSVEIQNCRKLAEQGKMDAQFVYGRCFEYGEGVRKNRVNAVRWYKKAASVGFAPAQYRLGCCFEYGWGIEQDYSQAVRWYSKAARQDYIPAQAQLGYESFYGKEGEKDDAKTILLLRKAAVPSSEFEIKCYIDKARLCLGNCYFYGYGVDQDFEEAVKWYESISPHILSGSRMRQIADCYYQGRLIKMDLKRAVIWYERAAIDGDLYAQYRLGRCYESGEGVDKDENEAIRWYRKAAEHGYAQAQYALAIRYYHSNGIKQINFAKAIEWLIRSVEQDYAPAQYFLGACYENGEGVEKNYFEAVKLYRRAAHQDLDEAQYKLGDCYCNGRGVDRDFVNAVYWFLRAAEHGNAKAQNNLAFCYERGMGVVQNSVEAAKWYEIAARQSNDVAQNNWGKCLFDGKGVKRNFSEAVKWFLKAAEQGNPEAMFNLGKCYQYGRGVRKNTVTAMDWYTKAAKCEHKKAKKKVNSRFLF